MTVYRYIYTTYWDDPFIQKLTPEEKYFYLYLMTNRHTRQCGCYSITVKDMCFDTGYNDETINKLITRFEGYGKIKYDRDNNELIMLNWLKHNPAKSPLTAKCIDKELNEIKNQGFRTFIHGLCVQLRYPVSPLQAPSKPLLSKQTETKTKKETETIKDKETSESSNRQPIKKPYGEFKNVYLTDEELKKLNEKYGDTETKNKTEALSAYIRSKGVQYKDHYATIIQWSLRDAKENSFAQKKGDGNGNASATRSAFRDIEAVQSGEENV